jgi:hypothetical protein
MANYAKINPLTYKVEYVIAIDDENDPDYVSRLDNYDLFVQTSYNTYAGVHYDPETGEPSADQSKALRKNFAGMDYKYDVDLDAFVPPKPYASWTLNTDTCQWEPPVAKPSADVMPMSKWDEETESWVEIEITE